MVIAPRNVASTIMVFLERQLEDGQMVLPQGMMTMMQGRRGDVTPITFTGPSSRFSVGMVASRPSEILALADTVLVGEPVELLTGFDYPAEKAPFMYHCHVLEHEDDGSIPPR